MQYAPIFRLHCTVFSTVLLQLELPSSYIVLRKKCGDSYLHCTVMCASAPRSLQVRVRCTERMQVVQREPAVTTELFCSGTKAKYAAQAVVSGERAQVFGSLFVNLSPLPVCLSVCLSVCLLVCLSVSLVSSFLFFDDACGDARDSCYNE